MPDDIARIAAIANATSGDSGLGSSLSGPLRLRAESAPGAIAHLKAQLAATQAELALARAERDAVINSTIWRASQPLRLLGQSLPASARGNVRRALRAAYRLALLPFGRRMADWQAARLGVPSQAAYERWVRDHDTLTDADRAAIRAHIGQLAHCPLISVVMPAYETPERELREAIASVQAQLYPNWELCIADDASRSDSVARVLTEAAAADPRIKWMRRPHNGNIAAATNSALQLARGEFVALMDHDDLLAEQALYEVAAELEQHPDADLIYSDEDRIDGNGRRFQPYFKPDWNIDLMLGQNFFCHLGVYRRALLSRIGGLREGVVDGSQDYDLALRAAAASAPARIHHIPAMLYHWRLSQKPTSFSQTQLDRCVAAAQRAIRDYLQARGVVGAEVVPAPGNADWTRVIWPLPDPAPRVTLIVPTRDRAELLARCADGVLQRTDYPNIELLIVDNDSRDPAALALLTWLEGDHRVRVLPFAGPFNYAALNNAAVRAATGEVVVLLNNDIDVIDAGWLREMVSLAIRPDVGAVGAKLLFGDGRIQHGGVVLGVGAPMVAGHFGHGINERVAGYCGQLVMTRELSAVTGACMALRKQVYEAAGGLDAEHLPISFNDVDLCLRLRQQGLRVLWTPHALLYHLESASRGSDATPEHAARAAREMGFMRQHWGAALDCDPFYNPNFDRRDHNFRLAEPGRRRKPWHVPHPAAGKTA